MTEEVMLDGTSPTIACSRARRAIYAASHILLNAVRTSLSPSSEVRSSEVLADNVNFELWLIIQSLWEARP